MRCPKMLLNSGLPKEGDVKLAGASECITDISRYSMRVLVLELPKVSIMMSDIK